MLINLVRDHQPDGVVVAFDRPEPTFRHETVETYKANRSAAPDILRQQMGLVREVLDALHIRQVELAGFEADDILATLAERAAADEMDVLIVTGDRDSYQLVRDPNIKVVYNKRGVSDYALYDEAGIVERTGVTPDKYVQFAALRGDNSDNLPGVPGVGEKTAAKLINKYDDIDGIYAHVDEQTPKLRGEPGRQRGAGPAQCRGHGAVARRRDRLGSGRPDRPRTLRRRRGEEALRLPRVQDLAGPPRGGLRPEAKPPPRPSSISRWPSTHRPTGRPHSLRSRACRPTSRSRWWPLSTAARPRAGRRRRRWGGLALVSAPAVAGGGPTPALWLAASVIAETDVTAALARLLSGDGPGVYAHDAKPLIRALLGTGIGVAGLRLDTSLAAYLLDPAGNSYPLDVLLTENTGHRLTEAEAPPEGQLDFSESSVTPAEATALDAAAVATLAPVLLDRIDESGLRPLNDDVEVPLVSVLARMEHIGVAVDRSELERLNADMTAEANDLAEQIQVDAGEEFNVNSTKKLREILFEKLELTPQKKTKTGYSTDQATLEKLSGEHAIIDHLLRYREVEKLRSTYGQSLLDAVADDDRIHATFNQTVARTGRLSSENPNLHNIPVRTELGRSFRRAFIPGPDRTLLVADYNQIELRCIAHLADDPGLVEAFTTGADVHSITAARVFDVEPEEVTFEQRSRAKMVSYGLAYGMEAYGLGQRLSIATKEAQVILDAYFDSFPAVKQYMEDTVTEARNRGYTEDAVRAAASHSRAHERQLEPAPGRRASGHERRHPGVGRRHLQGRARPPRSGVGRTGAGFTGHPAGPRRGDPRGAGGGAGRGLRAGGGGDGAGLRATGAAGGQPGIRRHLGRRQGLSVGTRRGPSRPSVGSCPGPGRPGRSAG